MFMGVNHGGGGGETRPPRICTGERGNNVRPPEFSTYNVLNSTVCRLFTKVWSSHLEWLPEYQNPQKSLGRWGFAQDHTGGAYSAPPYSLAGGFPKTPLPLGPTGLEASARSSALRASPWCPPDFEPDLHHWLCCHSNATRAPTANPPNTAQSDSSEASTTTLSRYIRVRAAVWACGRRQTDTQTDTQTRVTTSHNTFRAVQDSGEM